MLNSNTNRSRPSLSYRESLRTRLFSVEQFCTYKWSNMNLYEEDSEFLDPQLLDDNVTTPDMAAEFQNIDDLGRVKPRRPRQPLLDLIDEEVALKWHAQEPKQSDTAGRSVREAAAPFIEWLQNAEEESSADEAGATTTTTTEEMGATTTTTTAPPAADAPLVAGAPVPPPPPPPPVVAA